MSNVNPAMVTASAPYDNSGTQASFQQPDNVGPWGNSISGLIAKQSKLNVPFDQLQWIDAANNGCLPPPCKPYPSWPPNSEVAWVYPSLEKEEQTTLLGENLGCFPMAAPFVDNMPILPSVELPIDSVQGKEYSPQTLLNMYNCQSAPQPLTNKCFGYMPYDANFMPTAFGQGGGRRADGWDDQLGSPIDISSPTQPIAVGTVNQREPISSLYQNPQRNLTQVAKEFSPRAEMEHFQNNGDGGGMDDNSNITDNMEGFCGGCGSGGLRTDPKMITPDVPSPRSTSLPPTVPPSSPRNAPPTQGNFVAVTTNPDPVLTHTYATPPGACRVPNLSSNPAPLYNTFGEIIEDYKKPTQPQPQPSQPSQPVPSFQVIPDFSQSPSDGSGDGSGDGGSSNDDDGEVGFFVFIEHLRRPQSQCYPYGIHKIFSCMGNSLRGIWKDLCQWDRIPSHNKMAWILRRHDRIYYLLSLIVVICLLYYVLHHAWKSMFTSSNQMQHLFWITFGLCIVYLITPRTKGMMEVQKITALAIVGLVLWGFWSQK